jgi:hypothetical protein
MAFCNVTSSVPQALVLGTLPLYAAATAAAAVSLFGALVSGSGAGLDVTIAAFISAFVGAALGYLSEIGRNETWGLRAGSGGGSAGGRGVAGRACQILLATSYDAM